MNSNKKINLLVDAVKLALIIFIACALVSLIVLIVSDDPMTAITSFFIGPFTSLRRIGNIIEAAAPLMFTALAVIIIFGSGQFSMIAEGSFFIGTSGAMIVAIACKLPGGFHPAVAILFAGFCGAIVPLVLLSVLYDKMIAFVLEHFSALSEWLTFVSTGKVFRTLIPMSLAVGVGIGLVGSALSVRKHLRRSL